MQVNQYSDMVAGDTGTLLLVSFTNPDGSPFPLVGCSVRLRWTTQTGQSTSQPMQLVNGILGQASYQFAANDTYGPAMVFDMEILQPNGVVVTTRASLTLTVRTPI